MNPSAFQFRNEVKISRDVLFLSSVPIYYKVRETVAAMWTSIPSTLDYLLIAAVSTDPLPFDGRIKVIPSINLHFSLPFLEDIPM
jgi:hypothetical protein